MASLEQKRNTARDNIRKMMAVGANSEDVLAYIDSLQDVIPGASFQGIFPVPQRQHPETLPSQALGETFELPLAKMREEEQRILTVPESPPGRLGDVLGTAGLIIGSEVAPPAFLPQLAAQAGGVFGGKTLGDVISGEPVGEAASEGLGDVAAVGGIFTATRALSNIFSFLRGAGPTELQKQAQTFAKETPFEGRPLPARAGEFAERSLAAKIDRASNIGAAGRLFMKQQGAKIARFIEGNIVQLSGKTKFVEPSNVVAEAAPIIGTMGAGKQALKFGEGVGRNFENANIWLDQFFSPANMNLINLIKNTQPRLFSDLRASWIQSGIRQSQDRAVNNTGILLFDGNTFRAWYEGNRKMIRQVFGKEQDRVLDNFTAYVKFASPTAKRAFGESKDISDLAPAAAEIGIGAGLVAGLGAEAGVGTIGLLEFLSGGLSYALSRPGSPVYKVFSQPFSEGFPKTAQAARTGRTIGQAATIGDGRRPPLLLPGTRLPRRERRPTDPRFVPPSFPPRLPRGF